MLMSLCGVVQRPGCWVGNIYIFTSTGDHQLFPRNACTNLGPTAPSHPHHSLSVRFLKFCHLSYYTICSFTQRTTLSILGSLGTRVPHTTVFCDSYTWLMIGITQGALKMQMTLSHLDLFWCWVGSLAFIKVFHIIWLDGRKHCSELGHLWTMTHLFCFVFKRNEALNLK